MLECVGALFVQALLSKGMAGENGLGFLNQYLDSDLGICYPGPLAPRCSVRCRLSRAWGLILGAGGLWGLVAAPALSLACHLTIRANASGAARNTIIRFDNSSEKQLE